MLLEKSRGAILHKCGKAISHPFECAKVLLDHEGKQGDCNSS